MDTGNARAETITLSKAPEAEACCGPSASARATEVTKASAASLGQDWLRLPGYWLRDRRVLISLALAAVAGGAALNWSWLVAAGIAPILLVLAPCAVMCAIGACGKKGKSQGAACGKSAAGDEAGERGASLPARPMAQRIRASGSE